jgi:hypothetical protein
VFCLFQVSLRAASEPLHVGIAIVFTKAYVVCAAKFRGTFPLRPLLVKISRQILPIVGSRECRKCAIILEYFNNELKHIHGARAQSMKAIFQFAEEGRRK